MKKILFVLSILLLLTGCQNNNLENINIKDFYKLVENKETVIVYIGSKDCSACEVFGPELSKVLKEHNLKAKYIDINEYSTEERTSLIKEYNITGTPTVIFLKEGKEESLLNRINGSVNDVKIKEKLKSNGFIK